MNTFQFSGRVICHQNVKDNVIVTAVETFGDTPLQMVASGRAANMVREKIVDGADVEIQGFITPNLNGTVNLVIGRYYDISDAYDE